MKICIPSHRRSFLINSKTLSQIPKNLLKDTIVFCCYDEWENYENVVSAPVRVIGLNVKGIAQTRHEIGQFCQDANEDTFVMLDDDLKFIRRENPDTTKLIPADNNDMNNMFANIRRHLGRFCHVGVSARQGNNNVGIGSADVLVERNTRLLRVLAYRTKDFLDLEHGRVDIMEDFDITLQLLRKGKPNINLYWWSQDQDMTQAPGGCSEYRTHEIHTASVLKLKDLHSNFVKVVEKTNKTGGEFGTRTEARIQWKAAYEEGVRYVNNLRAVG